MSTVSVTNVKNASSSVNNAVTTSGGDLTNAAGVSFMGGSKNLLYNGAMQVAQRGTSTAGITTTGYYTVDRWKGYTESLGTWTHSVENDAPTGSGLRRSFKTLCTVADAAPGAGDVLTFTQEFEGQDLQRIAKGTSSAQQITLSFWVKSNVTGTYVVNLIDVDNARSVSGTYSISASATWERKTITFPADTTGAFDNDNNASLQLFFWLAAGSNYTSGTLNTSWASQVNTNRAVGQTNLAAATNNYWQITGVQLEVGPVATSFEFKSYGQELRECQRYYERIYTNNSYGQLGTGYSHTSTSARIAVPFSVTKRTQITGIADNSSLSSLMISNIGGNQAVTGLSFGDASHNQCWLSVSTGSVQTAGQGVLLFSNGTAAYIGFSAEL